MLHHQRPPTTRSYSRSGRNSSSAPIGSGVGMVASRAFEPKPTTPSKWTGSIVFAGGLSPILTYFIAGVVGRFLRRRLRPRPQGSALVVQKPEATPTDEPDSGQHRPSI